MVLLQRLRNAVKKLTFLLNLKNYLTLTQSTLRLIGGRAPAALTGRRWGRRAISFSDRPGLRVCVVDCQVGNLQTSPDGGTSNSGDNDRSVRSEYSSDSPITLRRSTSYPFEEDVDKQADMFIDNFYKHLIFEKQVSLNLRYCRDNSFDYSSNDSLVSPLSSASSQLVSPT
ncbi:hypothetical protein RND81_01G208200 [Saponaria officinalis]|uniref:Uncharacterized protein n=1 Tax=Saponaria officinalis TaxID=3572 RepID=A0AAW1N8W4_SAPOF